MKGNTSIGLLIFLTFCLNVNAATNKVVRWTGAEDQNAAFEHVINVLNQKLSQNLLVNDFKLLEERDLSSSHYKRYAQILAGAPIHGKSIRVWTKLNSDQLIQLEAFVEAEDKINDTLRLLQEAHISRESLTQQINSEDTIKLVRNVLENESYDDARIDNLKWNDEWQDGSLIRFVKVRSKRGNHLIRINLLSKKVIDHQYSEFPQSDLEIPAQVYPIYEEFKQGDGTLPRVPVKLKYIQAEVPNLTNDIFEKLRTRHYYDKDFDPLLGDTAEGQAKGYWSMSFIKSQASQAISSLSHIPNNFENGVLLNGRFATISIHPEGMQKFGGLDFTKKWSPVLFPNWIQAIVGDKILEEMVPSLAYYGKPIRSPEEAWNRPARRLSNHDPAQYIQDGFDELQVYYAINTLFESLQDFGFSDPELSTRPFHAFLYNPDIAYRDNAFYTDDTINFTTYSPELSNSARDNSVIWHELGHGIMDRLMGDHLELADTGGLSEGMADFVAAMVIQKVTNGVPFPGSTQFRINNRTGFFLTNEVHDDGEAYGGVMKDLLDLAIRDHGQSGLNKVGDLILEAMRLTRDHPALTASEWFSHLYFADSLGKEGFRESGELKNYLNQVLAGRNFSFNQAFAHFSLVNETDQHEVTSSGPGSRNKPIFLKLKEKEHADFKLKVQLKNSEHFQFKFPVQLKVQYQGGPLQGAIHWTGEENGTQSFTVHNESEAVSIPITASSECDQVNRTDGSCVDYVYVKIYNQGENQFSVGKKRFYLRVKKET